MTVSQLLASAQDGRNLRQIVKIGYAESASFFVRLKGSPFAEIA